jgi:hypothetical protein
MSDTPRERLAWIEFKLVLAERPRTAKPER